MNTQNTNSTTQTIHIEWVGITTKENKEFRKLKTTKEQQSYLNQLNKEQ